MDTQSAVYELLEPIVGTVGVELIDVEWTGGTLRVTIDHPDGVTTAKIVEVNRLISPVLDQHDPISGRYTLEVSSPGVERSLNRPDHFLRAVDEQVLIKLVGQGGASVLPDEKPIRRIKGKLISADGEAIIVAATDIDGVEVVEEVEHRIEFAMISKARTVFDWGPKEKPGKGPKKASKKSKSASSASPTPQSGSSKLANTNKSKNTTKEVHNGK